MYFPSYDYEQLLAVYADIFDGNRGMPEDEQYADDTGADKDVIPYIIAAIPFVDTDDRCERPSFNTAPAGPTLIIG